MIKEGKKQDNDIIIKLSFLISYLELTMATGDLLAITRAVFNASSFIDLIKYYHGQ